MPEGEEKNPASGASSVAPSIFISYASQDAAVAAGLVEVLEQHRIVCWIAPRDVKPGALYADAIVRAISAADTFVLVLSESSIASSHVGKEIERASSKKRPIIAVRIDKAPLTPALEYFLSESQWIDAPPGQLELACTRLINAIREPVENAAGPAGATPAQRPRLRRRRQALLTGIAIIAVVLTALLADQLWRAKRVSADKAVAATARVVTDKSIAVLPFADLSEKRDQEYFADGIAEEILGRLARVPGLRVVGRTSSLQFKGKAADSTDIGATLKVGYLLEGGVRREAGRVRVSAQLVEARNGSQRWADHFDADVNDVLHVQDTIAVEIARALQIAVGVDTVSRSSTTSVQVIDAYLRGLQAADRSTQEGLDAAVADFKQALTTDPAFAPAAIELGRAYAFIGSEGWEPTRVVFEKARETALLAQRLDPKSPAPHLVLAHVHTIFDWDWPGADQELQRAFALGPRTAEGVDAALILAAARGQWDEARQFATEAAELDPLNPDIPFLLGWTVHMRSGRFDYAEQSIRRGLQIAPKWGGGEYMLGEALMLQGRLESAQAEFDKETLEDGQLEGSAMAQFAAGRKHQSDTLLAEAVRHDGLQWPSEIARVYAYRGEKDRAFDWLDRAYANRDEDLYLIKHDPLVKNLEGDPRFKAFLRKMNLLD